MLGQAWGPSWERPPWRWLEGFVWLRTLPSRPQRALVLTAPGWHSSQVSDSAKLEEHLLPSCLGGRMLESSPTLVQAYKVCSFLSSSYLTFSLFLVFFFSPRIWFSPLLKKKKVSSLCISIYNFWFCEPLRNEWIPEHITTRIDK